MKSRSRRRTVVPSRDLAVSAGYENMLASVVEVLESARRTSARAVNAVMTAAYWEIGRRIVESEQSGKDQAEYGSVLVTRLAADLTRRFGRGFGKSNLYQMRSFCLEYAHIFQTLSGKLSDTGIRGGSPLPGAPGIGALLYLSSALAICRRRTDSFSRISRA